MGYESRVYVVERNEFGKDDVITNEIAKFNLGKVGYNFTDVFEKNDKGLYIIEDNHYIVEDNYGDKLTIAKAEDVMNIIESESDLDLFEYRRTHDLYVFLQSAVNNYNDLWCMHYGY